MRTLKAIDFIVWEFIRIGLALIVIFLIFQPSDRFMTIFTVAFISGNIAGLHAMWSRGKEPTTLRLINKIKLGIGGVQ